jgi:hypothetical protein
MSNTEKIFIGVLGGFAAVLVKFLGQDYTNVVLNASNLDPDQLLSYKIGYGLLTPILMFLGGFIAWISEETKRMKLAALAIAAPAIITTWSGGVKPDITSASMDLLVSSAYAQLSESATSSRVLIKPEVEPEKPVIEKIKDGVGIFFGYGKQPKRYWVIVGSYKDRDAAQQFADKINTENNTLNAWVGVRVPPNEYYPVIVGNYMLFSEANALKDRALATESINDAYLSAGARR